MAIKEKKKLKPFHVVISIKDEKELKVLDEKRGLASRTKWINAQIKKLLKGEK